MGVPDPPGEGEIWGLNPQPKHAIAKCDKTTSPMLPPGEYKQGVVWTCHSDSASCQITLVLVSHRNTSLNELAKQSLKNPGFLK